LSAHHLFVQIRFPSPSFLSISLCLQIVASKANEHNKTFYYLATALFGLGDIVLVSTYSALTATVWSHRPSAAFATLKLFNALGVTIAFYYSMYLQMVDILLIAAVMLGFS
jgi:hypothetical protein